MVQQPPVDTALSLGTLVLQRTPPLVALRVSLRLKDSGIVLPVFGVHVQVTV